MYTRVKLTGGPADGLEFRLTAPDGVTLELPEFTVSAPGARVTIYRLAETQWVSARARVAIYAAVSGEDGHG